MIKPAGNKKIPRIHRTSGFIVALTGIIILPVSVVLLSFFSGENKIWEHVKEHLLVSYVLDTFLLAGGVLFFTSLIGVFSAWLVVYYDFPGRKTLSSLLVLPMALPAYLGSFTFSGILDYAGPVQSFFRNQLGWQEGYPVLDIMNLPGAVFIMSLSLYPYIYLPVKSSFRRQAGGIYESARVLGVGGSRLFFRVALPLVRPALAGGAALVLMEVLNEYGAVHYLGVNTLTIGIFRSWFALGDVLAGMKLAAILLIIVFGILGLEKLLRGRSGFVINETRSYRPVNPGKAKAVIILLAGLIPVVLGFFIPCAQLVYWAVLSGQSPFSEFFLKLAGSTFALTAGSSLLIMVLAVAAAHILRSNRIRARNLQKSLLTMGYAIPGAVIAIGIMSVYGWVDRILNHILFFILGLGPRLILSGSFTALVTAYVIRYLGVAFNPVEAGFSQVSRRQHESARMLGSSSLHALLHIDLPEITHSLTAGFLLVFIDLLKELPLTVILRPFNFNTLATRAQEMANDERLPMTALPALVIIFMGLIPVIFLINRSERPQKRRQVQNGNS